MCSHITKANNRRPKCERSSQSHVAPVAELSTDHVKKVTPKVAHAVKSDQEPLAKCQSKLILLPVDLLKIVKNIADKQTVMQRGTKLITRLMLCMSCNVNSVCWQLQPVP